MQLGINIYILFISSRTYDVEDEILVAQFKLNDFRDLRNRWGKN
jgi:hypothetical protein